MQVCQVQVPCEICHHLVEGNTLRVPETVIVIIYAHLHTLLKKTTRRVATEVVRVTEDAVRDWTGFNTDVVFLDQIYQNGMLC